MEVLSTTDLLTGIVFADLKQVNDKNGHFAGDMLLKNAAITLQMEFEGCEIYRAGGDEFMVLSLTLTADEIEQRVQELRDSADDPECISFALGWCMDSTKHLRHAMRTADERMYADKERFYAAHPSLKRG